jgi:hypothetical protein
MTDIVFRRTGITNPNGSVPGVLTIGEKSWPTIERGASYTFVRKGQYRLVMCKKLSGRPVRCLCFNDSAAIGTHLIHDAMGDNHRELQGCIAPGLTSNGEGIQDSAKAMEEVFEALGGFVDWRTKTIDVQNNIVGDETKEQWIKRREAARKGAK